MQPASGKAICTVASQSHIGQFVVLLDSILTREPALVVFLLVLDATPDETTAIERHIVTYLEHGEALTLKVLALDTLYGANTETLRFCYDAFELCNIARGGLHKWLYEHTALEQWVYLDGDMFCFDKLDPLFDPLDEHDLIISAHRDHPGATDDEDLILLMFGPYNGGMLGVRRGPVGRDFVEWFYNRMLHYGRVDASLPRELNPHQRFDFFADQTWLALVPTYFDNVLIQKQRGLNFGPWCLGGDEEFTAAENDTPIVGKDNIVLLHLSGWQPELPHRLSRHYPRDMSSNTWWCRFTFGYAEKLRRAQAEFHRPYKHAHFSDGTPISTYQRRAYLKLQLSGKQLDTSPFESRSAIENLAADFHTFDYVSPGFQVVMPDKAFPNMVEGNRHRPTSPFHRKEVPHKWYVDIRDPSSGFVSRDEALLLYNTARMFAGRPALEIGAWLGWSACHLALGGVMLDVIDPLLANPSVAESVNASLTAAGIRQNCTLHAGASPGDITTLAESTGRRWNLAFIDGIHFSPAPQEDARVVEHYAAEDAIVLFHDLAFPDVAHGLAYFRQRGWHTMIYLTMQLMGVAWRGNVIPLKHIPDARVTWHVPPWLDGYRLSC